MPEENTIAVAAGQKRMVLLASLLAVLPSFLYAVVIAFDTDWSQWLPSFNYFVGYETGFGGRKLIGTLFSWVFPGMVTPGHVRVFILTANLLMLALLCLFMYRSLTMHGELSPGALALAVLYAVGPFSLMAFVRTPLSMGFMETYQLALVLAWLMLYLHRRDGLAYYAATLAVASFGILIHHTFCCTLMPVMVALCLMDCFAKPAAVWRKVACYAVVTVLVAVLLAMLWWRGGMNVPMDELLASMRERDVGVMPDDERGFRLLYYATNAENMQSNLIEFPYKYVEFGLSLLLLSPLLFAMHWPWAGAARRAEGKGRRWLYRGASLAVPLLTLPLFVVATDYSRWWIGYFFSMTAATLATYATGDRPMAGSLKAMWGWLKKHWWVAAALLVYAAQLCMLDYRGLKQAVELRWMMMPMKHLLTT